MLLTHMCRTLLFNICALCLDLKNVALRDIKIKYDPRIGKCKALLKASVKSKYLGDLGLFHIRDDGMQ